MGNSSSDLKRLPRCLHIDGPRCRCIGDGRLPPAENPPPVRNPEFTFRQLKEQTLQPVVTINIDKSLARYKLNRFHRKLVGKAKKEAVEFVQGNKPVLPKHNSLACIALRGLVVPATNDWATVRVCYEMKSFYIKGILVGKNFYELRKSGDPRQLVEGSIPLESGDTYRDMLGRENPDVVLCDQAIINSFWRFLDLSPAAGPLILEEAARCLGLLSLMLIEPSRQKDVQEKLCAGGPTDKIYFTMNTDCWEIIRLWDDRSKIAKGIEYKDKTVEEMIRHPNEVLEAVKQLSVVNGTKHLPVKKVRTGHTRAADG